MLCFTTRLNSSPGLPGCHCTVKIFRANFCLTKKAGDVEKKVRIVFLNKSFVGVELNIAELELCGISLQETFDFCTLLLGCLFK